MDHHEDEHGHDGRGDGRHPEGDARPQQQQEEEEGSDGRDGTTTEEDLHQDQMQGTAHYGKLCSVCKDHGSMQEDCQRCHNISRAKMALNPTRKGYFVVYMVTMAQQVYSKEEIANQCYSMEAERVVICEEKHEDGNPHMQFAIQVYKEKKSLIRTWERWQKRMNPNTKEKKSLRVDTHHTKGHTMWSWKQLCDYLMNPKKDKYVDPQPWLAQKTEDGYNTEVDPHDIYQFTVDTTQDQKLKVVANLAVQHMTKAEAIEAIYSQSFVQKTQDSEEQFDGSLYRVLMEYYLERQRQLPQLNEPSPYMYRWQYEMLAFLAGHEKFNDCKRRHFWIHLPVSSGKTWFLNALTDRMGDKIYYPYVRERARSGYSDASFVDYKNEPFVLMDELTPYQKIHPNGEEETIWDKQFRRLLKTITGDGVMAVSFGSKQVTVAFPRTIVIVCSNYKCPVENVDGIDCMAERFINVSTTKRKFVEIVDSDTGEMADQTLSKEYMRNKRRKLNTPFD
jgi:hypothetical protein